MKTKFLDLWHWEGRLERGPYACIGLVGFAIKHNLDRLVATLVFHRQWRLFNYWIPLTQAVHITLLSRADAAFLATMLAMALPFIWVGVVLTLRRLRSAGLPTWMVTVFFVPVVNLMFFLLLSILPSREADSGAPLRAGHRRPILDRLIPDHPVGSTAMALLLTLVLGVLVTLLGVQGFALYGWSLFVALPFCLGFGSVLLHGYHRPRSFASCLAVSWLSVGLTGAALLAFAIEGVICLMMAAPLGLMLASIGGAIGYLVQARHWHAREAPAMTMLLLLAVPALMGVESAGRRQPPLFAVRSAVEIQASPEQVWRHLVSFTELPPPDYWLFRVGAAYPMRAVIRGQGAGALRHCVFSTGAFVEPIQVWDAPRLLKFSVIAQPPPMREWTPYSDVHPAHLDHYFQATGGQFLLTRLPDGRTRLEGTTWYRNKMWPAAYWRLWSDWIVHRIHLRVLQHIRRLAASPDM